MEVVAVEPGALLVTAPATTPIARLHEELAPYRLALPIFPLVPGLTLADLVACNAGGCRRFAYGTIGRYVRAAQLTLPDGTILSIGGPTIKRATGYGLHRVLAASQLDLGVAHEFTFSLRPLPTERATTLLHCSSLAEACRLAAQLVNVGLALSALPVAEQPDGTGALLVELEGLPALLARQVGLLRTIAADTGATVMPVGEGDPWQPWYDVAAAHLKSTALCRDLTLPRATLPTFVTRARTLATRYRLPLTIWGDAGVGTVHLGLATPTDEAEQLLRILQALALEAGGTLSTELGVPSGEVEQAPLLTELYPPSSPTSLATTLHPDQARYERLMRTTGREQILTTLRSVVGDAYLLTRKEDIACYEQDASIAQPLGEALAVALPATTSEVAGLMRAAATYGLPIVVRGAGSGLAGGSTPTPHALILGLNRLDQITLDKAQMAAHVGA
ncbi:MAG: FAD-binding oxidoreductase, partial [Chloroflexia bacterium]|nr:FAD-binding oxidoreductase [Chloroflexia bacterium]